MTISVIKTAINMVLKAKIRKPMCIKIGPELKCLEEYDENCNV